MREKFSRKYGLNNHLKIHSEISTDTNIDSSNLPEEEKSLVVRNNGFPCSSCEKEYSTSDGLRRHQLTHTTSDEKPFQCKQCENKYSRQDTLSLHVKRLHGDETPKADSKERFPCEQCDKKLSRKDVLIKHVRNMHAPLLGHLTINDQTEEGTYDLDIPDEAGNEQNIQL